MQKLDNNSLTHCGFNRHEKPTHKVDQKLYEQQLAYWKPYINKLVNRTANIADRRNELRQCARIAIWNVLATHGKATAGFIYSAIKGTIASENAKDHQATCFAMNTKNAKKYKKARAELKDELGRYPTPQELADRVGVRVQFAEHFLLSRSYRFFQHDRTAYKITTRTWQEWDYYDRRRRELEDRLIHVIDQQWIDSIYRQTTGPMREGLDALMSDMSVSEWARRHNRKRSTIDESLRRATGMYRALHAIRYRLNDPVPPLEALRRKGVSVNSYKE